VKDDSEESDDREIAEEGGLEEATCEIFSLVLVAAAGEFRGKSGRRRVALCREDIGCVGR